MGTQSERSSLLILSVLLVAPSASLAGPVPKPHQVPATILPWGQGVGLTVPQGVGAAGSPGGFIYCAGCAPISPQQLVLPIDAKSLSVNGQAGGYQLKSLIGLPAQQQLGAGSNVQQGKSSWDGAIPVQQMALHDDGRYSFSYNTADATRQEERNLDGSVSGSYSYTDPEGKLVQIDYTAGPKMGYKAYGDNIPPLPVVQLPQPVQDTPEVQEARAKFLQTYARELARIQQDKEAAAVAQASETSPAVASPTPSGISSSGEEESTPSSSETSSTSQPVSAADTDTVEVSGDKTIDQDDDVSGKAETSSAEHKSEGPQDINTLKTALDNIHTPIAVPPNSQVGGHGVEDEDALSDAVVVSADNQQQASVDRSSLPSPSYQISIPIGVGQNAGLSVQYPNGQFGVVKPEQFLVPPQQNQEAVSQQGQQATAVPVGQSQLLGAKSNLQPYFYYVSVGGSPHFVTSPSQPGFRSPYPTSLRASLLGAIPLAAVHDAQVPNRGGGAQQYSTAAVRPVFLDLDGNSVQQQQQQPQQQENKPDQTQNSSPFILSPLGSSVSLSLNNNNQLYGQLVPLGLGQSSGQSASIGYIPAYIVNAAFPSSTLSAQQQQGQMSVVDGSQNQLQNSNVPAATFILTTLPQQSQPQQPPSSGPTNQPFFSTNKK